MIGRLRAVITPQILLFLILTVIVVFLWAGENGNSQAYKLERRAEMVLSRIEGAGQVSVVISMRKQPENGSFIRQSQLQDEVPCGAVAVAEGADDPFVCATLMNALSTLLGLPLSAVSVIAGG